MNRVKSKGRGWVFTPKHFIDFGSRGSVDMALSRLSKTGNIRRIGRGVYDFPRKHDSIGHLSPDPDRVAQALSRQSSAKIAPSGAMAVNRLGLSTQVPSKVGFATTGKSKTVNAGGRKVTFRHTRAPVLDHASDTANSVVQALSYLGRASVDDDVLARIAKTLDGDDLHALKQARADMPGWMGDAILKLDRIKNG